MNIEAIVGIVALIVALPPTGYILYKWYNNQHQDNASCKYSLTQILIFLSTFFSLAVC
jgi:hypothetical protein